MATDAHSGLTEISEPELDDHDPGDGDGGPTVGEQSDGDLDAPAAMRGRSPITAALLIGLMVVAALAGLSGWLAYRAHQANEADQQRRHFLDAARQGAVNLTTLDYTHADADVARILDSATGSFYDDFQQRAKPFIDVVKQAQSKSVGTIAEAGLESVTGDEAQALVAVRVTTTNPGAADEGAKGWRMRITVQKVGDTMKVSHVAFVP